MDTDTWFLCVCNDDSNACLTWPYAQDTTRLLQSIICTLLSKLCVPFLQHCLPDNFLVQGVKINTPHYLAKLEQVPQGTSTYTVIVSQLESLTTIHYTLRVCMCIAMFRCQHLRTKYRVKNATLWQVTNTVLWYKGLAKWACSWSASPQVYSTCEFVLNPVLDPYTHSKPVTVYFLHLLDKDNLAQSQAFHTLAVKYTVCIYFEFHYHYYYVDKLVYYTLMYVYYSFKESGILSRKNHQGSGTLTLSRNLKSWWAHFY